MARRSKAASNTNKQIETIKNLIQAFSDGLQQDDVRAQVRALIPSFHALRDLGAGLLPDLEPNSARHRVLAYLRKYPLTLIDGDELLVVSGISEWARRVRELRVEEGWSILTGVSIKELQGQDPALLNAISTALGVDSKRIKPDQYVLVREEQDREAAHRWNQLNEIRKIKGLGVKSKLLEYFRRNVGKPVTIEEKAYPVRTGFYH